MDSEERQAEGETVEFLQKLNELNEAFINLCYERHEKGQQEYGQFTFLGNDVVRMMLEELADAANYCRYQAVKLLLLQEHLEAQMAEFIPEDQEQITIGIKAFKGTGEVGWQR